MEKKRIAKDFLWITAGTVVVGTSVFFFLMPSRLIVASISGIAILLNHVVPLPVSVLTLLLNIVCLVLGFLLVGREFSGKTVYTSILLPLVIGFYEWLLPDFHSMTGDVFADMFCYIFLVGMGLAMLFTRNASSGGIDIIAKIMNRYLHMDLGNAMSAAGICISVSAIFVYDVRTVVLSLLGTYLQGQAVDHFIFGMGARRKVCILSEKTEELLDYFLHDLNCGATLYEAVGACRGSRYREIVAIVDKQKYTRLMSRLEKTDPNAYVTVYTVKEIREKQKISCAAEKNC